jgi:hypothetical protein
MIMATSTYTIGDQEYTRATKQGPPFKLPEQKRENILVIRLTDDEMKEYKKEQARRSMRPSEFGSLVLFLGIRELSVTDNC